MATAPKRWSDWLFRHGAYLDAVAAISAPVMALRGSDELRHIARAVVETTDEWAGVIPAPHPFDVRRPVFARLVEEAAKRADAEWPSPDGFADWASAFAELVRQADMAHT